MINNNTLLNKDSNLEECQEDQLEANTITKTWSNFRQSSNKTIRQLVQASKPDNSMNKAFFNKLNPRLNVRESLQLPNCSAIG